MGHVTILYKKGVSYGRVVLSSKTFEWSDIVAKKVLTCLVHPHHGSLLSSTVLNTLVSVTTWHAPAGSCINHLSEAQECCLSPFKYCLRSTAAPFGWCLRALFRFESCESPHVTFVTRQRFSTHHTYLFIWINESRIRLCLVISFLRHFMSSLCAT